MNKKYYLHTHTHDMKKINGDENFFGSGICYKGMWKRK